MPYINIDTEVFIEMEDFETSDLVEELESRGYKVNNTGYGAYQEDFNPILRLYELKRVNDPRFDKEFADFIYNNLGRVL